MTIKSILVATDLSAQENIAVQRAWQLADAHHATVKLMYLPAHGQQVPSNAASRLANMAKQLEESLERRVSTVPIKAREFQDLEAEARGMDLVVLPHRQERSAAALLRGQPVVRALRHLKCPVLVARQVHGEHYQRILVAVDFFQESEALVQLAVDLDSHARLEVFHAIGTRVDAGLRARATEQALRAYRERCLKHAPWRTLKLTDSSYTRRNRLLAAIGHGDPGRQIVIQQEHAEADLVVLGKRRSSAWLDFFCGSVAHRVLSLGSSDVLVVPHAYVKQTAPIAARRVKTGQPALQMLAAGRRDS